MKEADAFVLLPGGFGTLDEAFELLTLVQTGKAQPAPIVLLDVPGGTYWQRWREFVDARARATGATSRPSDLDARAASPTTCDVAVDEITGFYRNYHSLRFVDGDLVLRMQHAPDAERLAALNEEFADIVVRGEIEAIEATPSRDRRRRPRRARPARVPLRPPRLVAPAHAHRPPQRPP